MPTLQLTQVYLEREQKKGLQARAKANGTKVAEEVRRAVDAYLAGISPEDLHLLDEGTRKAQRHLSEMATDLDRVNAKLMRRCPASDCRHRTQGGAMSVITEILDRLSGVEVVRKLRDTGARIEKLAERVIELDRQVQDVDRRLVRIEAFAEIAKVRRGTTRKLGKTE
jgi:hypothetical protein